MRNGAWPLFLWSQGTRADTVKRIAASMVCGIVPSTVLTPVVIPTSYSLWKEGKVRRAAALAGGGAVDAPLSEEKPELAHG